MLQSTTAHRIALLTAIALAATACGTGVTGGLGDASGSSVGLQVTPASPRVLVGGQQVFSAVVTGTGETQVAWAITEGSAGGSISAGTYTAPSAVGVYHVVATSLADPTKSAVATVTVATPPEGVKPVVTSFAAAGTSSPVSVSAFTATDNTGVTGYVITESSTPPIDTYSLWQPSPPTYYTTRSSGSVTLYPWAKDASGNVSLAFGGPVTVTLAAPTSTARLGTNLNWCNFWDPEKMAADLVWQGTAWALGYGNGQPGADARAPIDAQGWPVVSVGTQFGAIFEIGPWPGTYKLSFKNRQGTSGDTVKSYSGNIQVINRQHDAASNVTSYDVVVPSFAPLQHIWLLWAGSTGGITDAHIMRPLKDGSGWHAIGTPLADYIVDRLQWFSTIRTMQTQGGGGKTTGLDTTWADRTSPWGPQTRSRGTPGHEGGVAIENLVAMANQVGKDLWINVPYLADDDYLTKMAQVIRYGSDGALPCTPGSACAGAPTFQPLRADLKLYVEHGNEIWNGNAGYWENENEASASADAYSNGDPYHLDTVVGAQAANDSGVPGLGWRRIAYLAVRASILFRQVFGDAAMMSRVRPIVGTVHGYEALTMNELRYVAAIWGPTSPYATVAGYTNPKQPVSYYLYGIASNGYTSSTAYTTTDTSPAGIIAGTLAELELTTRGSMIPAMSWESSVTAAYGLKVLVYEGGEGLIPSFLHGGGTASNIANAIQASYDPVVGAKMGARIVGDLPTVDQSGYVFGRLLQAWDESGGDLFVNFTLGEGASDQSMFGLCAPTSVVAGADLSKGTSSSDCRYEYGPKWDAIKAFSRAWH